MMNKYLQYKDSGIPEIGNVPEHWKKDKIARIVEFSASGGTPTSNNESYYNGNIVWVQTGELNDTDIFDTEKKLTEEGYAASSAKKFQPDTLLIAMYGATIGKLGILKVEAATNQACCALYFKKGKWNTKYFFYYFLSIREKLIRNSYGGGQSNINQEVIKQETLFLPGLDEQTAIANYLDQATAKIDSVISLKQQQLAKLEQYRKSKIHECVTKGVNPKAPMKDSGITWIGQIPEHWKVERIKDVCKFITSGGTPKTSVDKFWNGDIIWLSPSDFQDFNDTDYINNSRNKLTPAGLNDCSATVLPVGTVIMQSRASIGAVKISSVELCTNQGFINFITDGLLFNKYLFYMINDHLGYYFAQVASGTTFMEISRTKAKQEKIPLPSFSDQILICSFLDEYILRYRKEKLLIEEQIVKLQQYRKSLIHECVTGKRKVA